MGKLEKLNKLLELLRLTKTVISNDSKEVEEKYGKKVLQLPLLEEDEIRLVKNKIFELLEL